MRQKIKYMNRRQNTIHRQLCMTMFPDIFLEYPVQRTSRPHILMRVSQPIVARWRKTHPSPSACSPYPFWHTPYIFLCGWKAGLDCRPFAILGICRRLVPPIAHRIYHVSMHVFISTRKEVQFCCCATNTEERDLKFGMGSQCHNAPVRIQISSHKSTSG